MQLEGSIQLSGDKSISHRLLMYAAIAKGKSILHNLSFCDDVLSTIEVLRACNIKVDINSELKNLGIKNLFSKLGIFLIG